MMRVTFRWFGPSDPVPLAHIRQIPGVEGVVTALHDLPAGCVWDPTRVIEVRDHIRDGGLEFAVAESIPVHEDIKLGRPERERWTDNYCESIHALGAAGVPVLCYNFMPVFDWMRTDLASRMPDGSTALSYDDAALAAIDLSHSPALPGWAAPDDVGGFGAQVAAYADFDADRLWDHLAWFLERIVPAAEQAGVKLAVHPDDPPWPIFGLPRILTNGDALERVTRLVDSPANGVTLCTGSLGADPRNDVPAITRRLAAAGRIHFVHLRNVAVTGEQSFRETAHPTRFGRVDMRQVVQALQDTGFDGPARPDHGRMIWGERGRPGYGLHDRALGAMYLQGLWEGVCAAGHPYGSTDEKENDDDHENE